MSDQIDTSKSDDDQPPQKGRSQADGDLSPGGASGFHNRVSLRGNKDKLGEQVNTQYDSEEKKKIDDITKIYMHLKNIHLILMELCSLAFYKLNDDNNMTKRSKF